MAHLTTSKRDQIEVLRRLKHTQQEIADAIGCDQSTISRELRRGSTGTGHRYAGRTASIRAQIRKHAGYARRRVWYLDHALYEHVCTELKNGKSPEQIVGRMRYLGRATVSHQTIYAHIRIDKGRGGVLYRSLRYQGEKYKWRGYMKDRTKIPYRKDISERPAEVDAKTRMGDWESDLVVSPKRGSGAVATFVMRRCMLVRAVLVHNRSAEEMVRASVSALRSIPPVLRKSMTHDNGKEIARHMDISACLDAMPVYCARPYRSCDRGLNECMNRELRRFFPKGTDFSLHAQSDIDNAVDWLNNCPRKTLGYRTPCEVYTELTMQYAFHA